MITPRLQKIINMTDSRIIADIGTDHAYIPIKLALENRITRAVACDINSGPLEIARKNVKKYGLDEIIELRLSNGLEKLKKNETELIIIAGMGGNLIGDIIEADLEKAITAKFILQPMNAQYELRKRLIKLGFKIDTEELVKEGIKVYNVMEIKAGRGREVSEIYYHIPKELLSHELCPMLIDKKKREFKKIIDGQLKSANPNKEIISKYEQLNIEINALKKQI